MMGADGSKANPFVAIQDAVTAASDGFVIHLMEGTHAGGVFALHQNLSFRGAGVGKTLIVSSAGQTGLLSTGSGLSVRDLTFKGGALGIHIVGDADNPLEGAEVINVAIEDIVAAESTGDTSGSDARGIAVAYVNGVKLLNVSVTNVTGEVGGTYQQGLSGGTAYGAWIEGANQVHLLNVSIAGIDGGTAGPSDHLGQPGGTGGDAVGLHIQGSVDVDSVGLSVSELLGGMGGFGFKWGNGGQGGRGIGLRVLSTSELMVTGAALTTIGGHRGGDTFDDGKTGAGGDAHGAWFESVEIGNFEASRISGLESGANPPAGHNTGSYEKVGGVTTGVSIVGSSSVTVSDVEISALTCGRSSNYWHYGDMPYEGQKDDQGRHICAQGMWIDASQSILVERARINDLSTFEEWGLGTTPLRGIAVDASEFVSVQQSTIYGLVDLKWPDATWHCGVCVGANQVGALSVLNTIVSTVAGSCLHNSTANSGLLSAAYSLFDACPMGAEGEQASNATTNSCISADPLFVAPDDGDFSLQAESPALDVGKPSTSVCQEPEPNGCYPNLGAFGGTGDATGSASGIHCPCEAEVVCPEAHTCSDGDPCTDDVCAGGACEGTDNGSCP